LIIREYERYGKILEHFSSAQQSFSQSDLPPSEILHGGNWIRITYADPVSAARAIATNGQLVGGAYMIGVIYAPKSSDGNPPSSSTVQSNEMEIDSKPTSSSTRRREETSTATTTTPGTPVGERKMNVVKGESMFVKKDTNRANTQSWSTWAWTNLVGEKKRSTTNNTAMVTTDGVVAGGGQTNFMVKALQGLSETVFGF
jgi:Nup53/35/40-type RNA recognition motif